jgi:hypothetical protein
MRYLEHRLRVLEGVDSTEVDGSVIALEPSTGQYLSLNRVAARFWTLIQEDGRVSGAVSALLEEYDVERERLQEDLESLIDQLLDLRLVEVVSPEPR